MSLAPGTERNELAAEFAETVRANVTRSSAKRELLRRMQGLVYVVVNDPPPGTVDSAASWGGALTLRFDFGLLTIHDGLVGRPDLTLRGDPAVIAALPDFKPRASLPVARRLASNLGTLWWIASRRALGERLTIYGLKRRPGFALALLRIISRHRW
ncbi:MAG: hypothetical protein KIT72_14400 [Polyangiaceae bacterium]|nr:hypothetical protein [Polyangiaceae bacterium]